MSRMTLLDGTLWFGLSRPHEVAGKAAGAGYPPYNIELLGHGKDRPESVRVTLV